MDGLNYSTQEENDFKNIDKPKIKKIPKIEIVLIIPQNIRKILTNLLLFYTKNLTKSNKILKKSKHRLKTNDFIKNLKLKELLGNLIDIKDRKFVQQINLLSDEKFFENIRDIFIKIDEKNRNILTDYIIDWLDKTILKYIKIIVHVDDQIYICSKRNQNNNKIFLKFFLPRMLSNNLCPDIVQTNDTVNSLGDNIHATILPTIGGHLFEGLIHLTFRMEGRTKTIFEYSKYMSLNKQDNKFGFVLYSDETGSESIIFKIFNEFDKIIYLFRTGFLKNVIEELEKSQSYQDMCKYIVYDIINQMIIEKVIHHLINKYFNSIGISILTIIIEKITKIIFLTFIELCFL